MFRKLNRLCLCLTALAVLAPACSSANGFELSRVQRRNVKVLPGANGFTNPLTGVVSYSPQPWQRRPVLAIKVGNSYPERPQAGLDRADVVYEELVEGGETRFMALFLTNQAPRVGPVRSVRTVDHKILEPLGALFGYSGGVPPIVAGLRSTPGITDVGADREGDAYYRSPDRSAPYNLYTSTDRLWVAHPGTPPAPQFSFLSAAQDAGGGGDQAATSVRFSFAGNASPVRYAYDDRQGDYRRSSGDSPHMVQTVGDDVQLAFRNVLVQMVQVSQGSTVDRAGDRSRDVNMIGDGAAVLFRGGRAFRGRWERKSVHEPTRFVGTDGTPLLLAPGETVVELLPAGRELFVS